MKNGLIKKLTTFALCGLMAGSTTAALTGCGNKDLMDMHYTFNYVVIEENDQHILHAINKWSDSESESVTISTKCCGNYIWTSSNRAVLYQSKPAETAYDAECKN